MRERSLVRSSVIPSTKYSCSGSFERFVKGRTTIDRRGAEALAIPVAAELDGVAAGTWTAAVGDVWKDHCRHALAAAIPTTAMRHAAINKVFVLAPERSELARGSAGTTGKEAIAAASIAKTRTRRAIFLTLCSPMSSKP